MDVDRLAELIEQIELGDEPQAEGEETLLLSVASELRAMAPQVELSQEQEDRIFAKFLDLAPEAAPELEPELEKVADVLGALAPAAIEEDLSEDAKDRIFAAIEERVPQLSRPKTSWLSTAKLRLAAYAPRPLIQRQADALDSLISDSRSGRKVHAKGRMADLLTAAMSLQPVPAIAPSPSFVDWLEVRLMSPANQIEPAKRRFSPGEAMRSTRFQTGLAGACAAMVALAVFNLGGDGAVRTPAVDDRQPQVAVVTPEEAETGNGFETPAPLVPTVAAPAQTGTNRVGGSGSGNNGGGNTGGGNNNGGGNDGGNNGGNNGGEGEGGSDSLSQVAGSPGEASDRLMDFLNGEGGGN